jgi:DNA-directed RNA polymerase specialized sigma24 family protein
MKNAKDSWKQDVEKLLEQSVVEDAVARVFAKLEAALGELDGESRELLSRFFEGTSIATLSEEKGVSQDQIKLWIERAKRELYQQLRTRCAVRQ